MLAFAPADCEQDTFEILIEIRITTQPAFYCPINNIE
ncbi:MAG: hypothetical protein ACI843_000644 [Psychrobacter glaciei]|jgi:hypothetical protein